MRTFRNSMLAGAGAVALAAGVIAPGVASADSLGSLGSSDEGGSGGTATITVDGRYELSATGNNDCTVDFELNSLWEDYQGTSGGPYFRADYQVDDEDHTFNSVYRPVVVSAQNTYDAITNRDNPYDIGLNTAAVDLTEARTVPDADDISKTVDLPGVAANADGTHEITFGVYQGPNGNDYDKTKTVTVTGCPTAEEEAFGSLASLDVFGSLGSLLSTDE